MSDTSGVDPSGYPGFIGLTSENAPFNHHEFHHKQLLTRVRTVMAVKIIAVHGGGVGAAPTVDVQPMVKQVDGLGNAVSHGIIYGIPVARNQGGGNVVINDPVVGDVGIMSIHDRDISTLAANNGAESPPGSSRKHNASDGTYHGAMLNQTTPTQYIQFQNNSNGSGNGLKIVDAFNNTIQTSSSGINLNGLIIDTHGNLTTPGGVQAGTGTGDSVTLQHHTHPGTTAPTPGT